MSASRERVGDDAGTSRPEAGAASGLPVCDGLASVGAAPVCARNAGPPIKNTASASKAAVRDCPVRPGKLDPGMFVWIFIDDSVRVHFRLTLAADGRKVTEKHDD